MIVTDRARSLVPWSDWGAEQDQNARAGGQEHLSRRLPPLCLLDTGYLDTFMARELAEEAGINLTDVEDRDPFPLGGAEVTGLPKVVDCLIEDGTGAAITLKDIRVVFTSPWLHPGFGAVLGTIAMQQIQVTVSAGQRWIEIWQEEMAHHH